MHVADASRAPGLDGTTWIALLLGRHGSNDELVALAVHRIRLRVLRVLGAWGQDVGFAV